MNPSRMFKALSAPPPRGIAEGTDGSSRPARRAGLPVVRALGLACTLGMAASLHADGTHTSANAPTNILVNFAAGSYTYTQGHCREGEDLRYRFGTSGGWTSHHCGSTAGANCTVSALANETNDYVETQMRTQADPPHCSSHSAWTTTIAYTRTTLASNRGTLTDANLRGAT